MVVHSTDKGSHTAKHSFLLASMAELKLFVNIYFSPFERPVLLNTLPHQCLVGCQA